MLICCLGNRSYLWCWSGRLGNSSSSLWFFSILWCIQNNFGSFYCTDFRNSSNPFFYFMSICISYQTNIKAMVKFFLLQILSWWHRLNNIAQLVQNIHNHVGTSGFQKTSIRNLHMYPERNQATILGLSNNQHICIIQLASLWHLGLSRFCRRLNRSSWQLHTSFCLSLRHRLSFSDGINHTNQLRYINCILTVSVGYIINHFLQCIYTFEDYINNFLANLQLFLAEHIQKILHIMSQLGSLGIAHSSRHTLQGVSITENLIKD